MSNCIQQINHSNLKFEENQSKFILENPDRKTVDYITVDGCFYAKNTPQLRCDYAANYSDTTIFIELKGSDITHAIKQIIATKQDAKFSIKSKQFAVVVSSKTPKDDSSLKKQKIQLKNQNITLIHGNSPLKKKLTDFT